MSVAGVDRADDVPEWVGDARVTVDVHVYERTVLRSRVHPDNGRVVLHIEGVNRASLHLYARRADLARLIEMAAAALAELDASSPAASEA